MPERPPPVNDPASVQRIIQPLQGSVEQAAPPTTSSSQAGATSGTTASGNDASQSSSQEDATGSNVSNNSTVTLEVFSYSVVLFCILAAVCWSFLVAQRCIFLGYVFPVTRESGFSLRAGSTWSVIYSVGLARIQFLCQAIIGCFILWFAVVIVCFLSFVCLL